MNSGFVSVTLLLIWTNPMKREIPSYDSSDLSFMSTLVPTRRQNTGIISNFGTIRASWGVVPTERELWWAGNTTAYHLHGKQSISLETLPFYGFCKAALPWFSLTSLVTFPQHSSKVLFFHFAFKSGCYPELHLQPSPQSVHISWINSDTLMASTATFVAKSYH